MQTLSLIWGILAIVGMFVGLIPCIGALNWLNIPFSIAGLLLSVAAHALTPRQHRTSSTIGIILCIVAIIIGAKRLIIGAGIL